MAVLSGIVKDEFGAFASRLVRAYRKSDGVYAGAALSDPTTGAWSITVSDTSKHFAIAHDGQADPHWTNVTAYLSMDDTGLTDAKGNTITKNGHVARSSTQSLFDGFSALFDGNGDWLSWTSATAPLGTGDCSIDVSVYINSLASDGELYCVGNIANSSQFDCVFEYKTTGAVRFSLQNGAGGVNVDISSSAGALTTGTWYQLRAVASGSTAYIYNGATQIATGSITGTRVQSRTDCRIGRLATALPRDLNCYIDAFRTTNGVARVPKVESAAFLKTLTSSGENARVFDDLIPV